MGRLTGFMDYPRKDKTERKVRERLQDFNEFRIPNSEEDQHTQAARCMNCGVPNCQWGQLLEGKVIGCPLNNLIPEFNDALYQDQEELALQRLLKTNPFPEFTSRVCPALCEKACTCGLDEDPVTVKDNEYAIIEKAFELGLIKPAVIASRTGRKIAVIGSGPAGLAAADWLNRRGHEVTVYEKDDRIGGLLMYGIPNMKLAKQVIARREKLLKESGIHFVTGTEVSDTAKAQQIANDYDAVVLACGSRQPRGLNIELPAHGAYYAVDYLSQVTKHLLDGTKEISAENRHVVVVGGGDTGNDCVGSSLRQHCSSVIQLEIMPEPPLERTASNPWPEWPNVKKTDYGQEEAIEVFGTDPRRYKTTVKSLEADSEGNITSLTIIKTALQKDEQGRMGFANEEGSEETIPCDLLLIAAGFAGCESGIIDAFDLPSERGRIIADGYHVKDNIFTAGDMHIGQSLVVRAIQEGIDCAKQLDQYLIG